MRDLEYTLVIRIGRARSALQIARELRTEEYMRYKDRISLRGLEESVAKQLWFLAYLYHRERASASLDSVATEAWQDNGSYFLGHLVAGLLAKTTVEPVKHQETDLQFFAEHGRDMSAALWCLKKLCTDEATDVRWETAVARAFFPNSDDPMRELKDSLDQAGTRMEQAIAAESNSAAKESARELAEEEELDCLPTPEQIEREWASRARAWSELGLAGNVEAAQRPMAMMQKALQSVLKEMGATEPFGPTRENQAPLAPGMLFADRYRIELQLGHGKSSAVYRVVDRLRGTPYALRILPVMSRHAGAQVIERLRVQMLVHSDHIVKIHAIDQQADGTPWLLMELLQGETLAQRLSRAPVQSLTQARGWLYELGAALATLHDLGVIHRDVKPSNVFLCTAREGGEVLKLLDWGLRSALDLEFSQLTQNLDLDTISYRAPEAIYRSGAAVDARADQFSLAVVAYQLLSGHLPFDGESPAALIRQVLSARPVSLTHHAANISPKVAQIIERALSKNPQDRFATIQEFSTALHAALLLIPDALGKKPGQSQPRTSQWGMVAAPAASSKSGPAKVFQWTCKVDELGEVTAEEAAKAREGEIYLLKVSLIGELLPDAPNAKTDHYLVEWDVSPQRPLTKLRFRFQRGESGSRWIRLDAPVGREFINLPGDQEPQFILTSEPIE